MKKTSQLMMDNSHNHNVEAINIHLNCLKHNSLQRQSYSLNALQNKVLGVNLTMNRKLQKGPKV